MQVQGTDQHWFIEAKARPHEAFCMVATIPRTQAQDGLPGVIADTLLVAGPKPRARLYRLVLDIRAWAMDAFLDEDTVSLLRYAGVVYLRAANAYHALPPELDDRLLELREVLIPAGGQMSNTSSIALDLPRTAHGALALRAALLDS